METNTLTPVTAQPKTIAEKIAEEKIKDELLYQAYCRSMEANEPTKKAMEEAGRIWCACRRRIEMLEEMQKDGGVQ